LGNPLTKGTVKRYGEGEGEVLKRRRSLLYIMGELYHFQKEGKKRKKKKEKKKGKRNEKPTVNKRSIK